LLAKNLYYRVFLPQDLDLGACYTSCATLKKNFLCVTLCHFFTATHVAIDSAANPMRVNAWLKAAAMTIRYKG
jgi:hypothetical protein